jgi:aminopeptidase-like protein
MLSLIRDLCAFRTAVVADANAGLFARIGRELPTELFRFGSGDTHNGWVVPQNWRVKRAKLFRGTTEIFDATPHALGVGYYSKSFSGDLDWEELQPKLVSNPDLPDALMFHCMWQYRPWDADWRLSIPHGLHATLGPGRYRVELATEYEPGEMLVAHCHKPGRSEKTIVFNAHTCHPHMANDGLAGAAVLIRLMQKLMARDTFYSYRLVLGPEHLGTVFYLRDRPRDDLDRLVSGLFEEMPGTRGPIKATATFRGGQKLDKAVANALRHHARTHELVAWRKGAGNDETVWEAPGYEVPFVEITRCEDQFAPFREYHSSLDTPDLMDESQLDEMLLVMEKIVDALENDVVIHRRFDGLICLSNPAYDLYLERPDPTVVKNLEADGEKWGHLLDCLTRYFDGSCTALEIAERHSLPFDRLRRYLGRFEEKGLVALERSEIARLPPPRAVHIASATKTLQPAAL